MYLCFFAQWLRDQGIVERLVDLVGNEAGSEVGSYFITLITAQFLRHLLDLSTAIHVQYDVHTHTTVQ